MEILHQPEDRISQRYRILDTLGQGGSGTTYLAEDLQSGNRLALKTLSLHRMSDWKMMELFEREARVLAQLNHPAIPRYLDYFYTDTECDRLFYIVQQVAEGQSLDAWVKSGLRTSEEDVRHIAIQVLEILVYLHSLTPPVIHRDIKPQNIIRSEDGQVSLVDFGAVQDTYHSTFARSSTVVGTFGYMAPEQFRGQAVPATDLYALGATLLFLLTHRSPAELPTDRLRIDFRSRVQISEEFADWLEKMLEPDVEDRFSSAKEALFVLRGKRKITRASSSVSWKALVGVGVAAVAAVSVLNSYKWAMLGNLGFMPSLEICENPDAIKSYLKQGGNPDSVISYHDTAEFYERSSSLLECAVIKDRKDIAELLIDKGADINSKDQGGKTPLYYMRSLEMAQFLIAQGADVNVKAWDGTTPLFSAADQSNKEMAQFLIAQGADVNVKDKNGMTPLRLATMSGAKDIVEVLKSHGAK
jgi:serine/threonine protein kinase